MENSEQSKPNPDATTGQSESSTDATGRQATQELMDELAGLANRLTTLGKSWWNSDERKHIEQDLRSGIESLGASLESSFQKVASSHEAKDIQTKASEVGEKVTNSKLATDLTTALKSGIQSLGDQLDKVAKDLEAKSAAKSAADEAPKSGAHETAKSDAPADAESKNIPIDKA